MVSSVYSRYFSASLTSTASVAKSIKRVKLLMPDMKNRESNDFIQLRKRKGEGKVYDSFYDVVDHRHVSGANRKIQRFLRDTVALRYGNLAILRFLRSNGCPWNEWTCKTAASYGHLEILQWLHTNGCPCNGLTCKLAASNGHLEVLEWARANGCPWDESTCAFAASSGHLEVLQWARANGCPE